MAARNAHLKERALALRSEGKSLNEILEFLPGVNKTTVYYWIKGTPLIRPPKRGRGKAGGQAVKDKFLSIRQEAYDLGTKEAPQLMGNLTVERDFVLLFLTEGWRKSDCTVSVANSEPYLIRLALKFYQKYYSDNKIHLYVSYYPDHDPEKLKQVWLDELKLEPGQIRVHMAEKKNARKLKGRRHRCQFGVGSMDVHDFKLRERVQAWCDWLKDQEWNFGD